MKYDENLTKQEIGEYIRNMRKAASLTQVQLAALMGVNVKRISEYERANRQPPHPKQFVEKLREVVCQQIRKRREANRK